MEIDPSLATLATGVGIMIASVIAYFRKPAPQPQQNGDDIQIVGGSLSDRTSMRILAEANLKLADAMTRVAESIEEFNRSAHDQGIRDRDRELYDRRGPSRT